MNEISQSLFRKFCLLLSLFKSQISKIELQFQNLSNLTFKYVVLIQMLNTLLYYPLNILKVKFHFIFHPKFNNLIEKIYPYFLIWNDVKMSWSFVNAPLLIFSEVAGKIQEVKQGRLIIHLLPMNLRLNRTLISISFDQFEDIKVLTKF